MSSHGSTRPADDHIPCRWDAEARLWYVAESNVPGLAAEADTAEAIRDKLLVMIPELVELNSGSDGKANTRVP